MFDVHHPWVLVFGALGNIVSFFVYLSPLPTFIRICKNKSTLGYQSVPYVVALFSAMLWMYYAMLQTDAIMLITINAVGCIIETTYIVIYLRYAPPEARKRTLRFLTSLNVVLFSAIFLVTYYLEKPLHRVKVVGWVCVIFSVSVFAAPLSIAFQVVRTKSVEFMPFTLSCTLTLTAVIWFFYGLLKKDFCVAFPNVIGFFLGVGQMLLYFIYRNKGKVVQRQPIVPVVPEQIINIVVLRHPEKCSNEADQKENNNIVNNQVAEIQIPIEDEAEIEIKLEEEENEIEKKPEEENEQNEEIERSVEENYTGQVNVEMGIPRPIFCAA